MALVSAIKKGSNILLSALSILLKGIILSAMTICSGNRVSFKKKINGNVLLCGNGPSLASIDLEKVNNDNVNIACVNYFPVKNPLFFTIKPTYLFLIDPWFFNPPDSEVFEDYYSNQNAELYGILEQVNWDMTIVSLQGYTLKLKNPHIRSEHISKYSLSGSVMTSFLDFLYEKNLLTLGARNVTVATLFYFISHIKGEIFLTGVDMSEFKQLVVDEYNNVFIETVHDYGTRCETAGGLVQKGEFYKLLGMYQGMFEEFYYLSKYAERKHVSVKNLSKDSYLDMFDKIEMESWRK